MSSSQSSTILISGLNKAVSNLLLALDRLHCLCFAATITSSLTTEAQVSPTLLLILAELSQYFPRGPNGLSMHGKLCWLDLRRRQHHSTYKHERSINR